jgi:hypothetical protein
MRKKPAANRTRRRSEWVDRRREGGCRDKGGELPVLAPESEHVRVVGARLHRLEALERRHRVPEQQPENPGRGIRVRTRTRAPSEAKKKKKMQRGIPWAVRGGWAYSRILERSSPSIFAGPGNAGPLLGRACRCSLSRRQRSGNGRGGGCGEGSGCFGLGKTEEARWERRET